MKAFNKDKALRKLKFKQNRGKYIKRVSILLSCLILVIGIIMFTFAKFESTSEWTLIEGTVTEPSKDANIIAIYVDEVKTNTIPAKNGDKMFDRAVCDNGATATWDNNEWGILIKNMTAKTKCTLYFKTIPPTVVEHITNLASTDDTIVSDGTTDNNLRYIGANPNNYVSFNNELWRIIGLMNNIETQGGQTQSLVKIKRAESLGNYSWDSSERTINSGYGVNEWSQADLMQELNNDYLGNVTVGTDGKWYESPSNNKRADKPTTTINSEAQSMIESVKWKTGSPSSNNGTFDSNWGDNSLGVIAPTSYTRERAATHGKTCTSGSDCTDTVPRTSSWIGKVGLFYPSDYLYATSGGNTTNRQACLNTPMRNWTSVSDCFNNDWLYSGNRQWTISPNADANVSRSAFIIDSNGNVSTVHCAYGTTLKLSAVPAVFLKSSIVITSGDGSSSNPYTLG